MKRRLPNWLMDLENEDVLTDTESSDTPTKEHSKTSNVQLTKDNDEHDNHDDNYCYSTKIESNSIAPLQNHTGKERTRYSLRTSQIGNKSNEADIKTKSLPFIEYKGRVEYYTDIYDIAIACDSLMTWVDKQQQNIVPIAFDMEWPFSFKTGAGKSAVIQLCADINVCYVLHISQLKKLPAALVCLLKHPKVRLHGVNIKNDCRKLERDFKEVNSQVMIDQCLDLGVWCNEVINSSGRWSMSRLVLHICKMQINKDRIVRMSKWHIQPLTKEQQMYAAIDVYISQVIYYELEKRRKERDEETKAFVEKYGE